MSHYGTDSDAVQSDESDTSLSSYGSAKAFIGSGAPVVSFENVSKHYGSLRAVDGLTLDLRPGETVALLGPNGAGKSTSLDMLLALRKPTSGQIKMFGSDPYHAVKSGRVGAMLQSGGLMPEVTVLELVTLVNVEVRHDLVQIQTSDSDATLYAVLDAGYRPHEIEVTGLGLEQAFLAITAEDDRANGNAQTGNAQTGNAQTGNAQTGETN